MMTTNPDAAAPSTGRRELAITTREEGGLLVLRFEGDLIGPTIEAARERFQEAIAGAGDPPRLIIDLEACEFMDSSGLGFFLGCLKKIREADGDLKLANINAYMIGIFRLINLHYIIDCHETLEKAVASFQAS